MAKTYYAATKIKGGKRDDNGEYVSQNFEVDDKVTGLDKQTMIDLWKAGALTTTVPEKYQDEDDGPEDDSPEADENKKPAPAKAQATPAKQTPAKATTPAAS
jgi:hypothetical protein